MMLFWLRASADRMLAVDEKKFPWLNAGY